MDKMAAAVIVSDVLMAWVVPVAIVVIATLAGWIVERIVMRWARSMARRLNHRRDSMIARAVRGHVTFWGFLLGVALAYDTLTTVYKNATTEPARSLFSTSTITYVHQGLLALFLVSLTWMLAGVVTVIIVASSVSTARPVVSLVTNVTRFVVLVIGFLLVMSVFGVSITPWLTTLGVAGLAVSLALQATLTDLVSGMLLLATRQITIGDYVKLSTGEEGYVSDIAWRTTTIRQLSNNIIIVPNSKMTSSSLTNYHTHSQTTSVTIDLGVSYNSDLDQVERVTTEVAREVMTNVQGGMPEFQPFIRYNALGDYAVKFTVIMQAREVTDQYLIKHEFIKRLRARYRAEGIMVPYPIQTVQVRESTLSDGVASARDSASRGLADGALPDQASQASANSSEASSR
ncbi:MAG TPA: mechanosensitive ion channel family protein [Ktedonobacterales bacterium]